MIVHYNLLKLTRNADVTEIYFRCRKIYAELELALPFPVSYTHLTLPTN